jgi:hypothetical protein
MRNAFAAAVIGFLGTFGVAALGGGEKPPESFVNAMKTLNRSIDGITKATASGDFASVKKDAAAARQALDLVVEFWDTKKNASATGFARDAIQATSDLETAADQDSAEGVEFALKQIQSNCSACHKAHREALPNGGFEIK